LPLASISKDNKDISGLSSDQEIVVYCRSGGRAESARSKLLQLGFTDVVNGINQDQLEHNS
jgi:rhodanese-related sulfurtransferase